MNVLCRLYHFLGSVYFAIVLISTVASIVIAGTFIESRTDSHRYAAMLTYGHPFFALLLWGFFVNILFSATRRWPFEIKHIPFLITHIGLLMILAGTLIKNYAGVQGTMSILEGSYSHTLLLPDSYTLRVEKRDSAQVDYHPIQNSGWKKDSRLQVELIAYQPHAQEKLESWIKGDHASIRGLPSFPVQDWNTLPPNSPLPISGRARLHHPEAPIWEIAAGRTSDIDGVIEKSYLQGLEITIRDTSTDRMLFQGALQSLLNHPQEIPEGTLYATLELPLNPQGSFENASLALVLERQGTAPALHFDIPLQGQHCCGGLLRWEVDLKRTPLLLLLEGSDTLLVCGFDAHGQVFGESFHGDSPRSLIAYDQGYGGYAVQTILPFPAYPSGRVEREAAQLHALGQELRKGLADDSALAPPTRLISQRKRRCASGFRGSPL